MAREMPEFEVAIVGAGVHGSSAAFHLASRGVRVAIFDQRGPAGGPTGRSSAICRAYYTNEFLAGIAARSIEMFANFEEIVGGPSGFRRTGFVWIHGQKDTAELDHAVPKLGRAGVTVERLDAAEIAKRFPVFDVDDDPVAMWEPGAGYADPVLTTTSLLNRAVALGARQFFYSGVIQLQARRGGGYALTTARGDVVEARRVLLAAGPWTRGLAEMAGVNLPLTVERHIVAIIKWEGASAMRFGHGDLVSGQYYCKPEGDDLYCLGRLLPDEAAEPNSFRETLAADEGSALAQAAVARVPGFSEAKLVGGWASLYDVSPDWQPVIGEIAEGLYVNAGSSGHGFKLAPALGGVVADVVMGGNEDAGVEQFHPRRFARGELLGAGYGDARILG